MGIDVYAQWDGMTEAEKQAQYTGFSIEAGNVGYLREAYHGGPYATRVLFPECFEDSADGYIPIPATTLRERLPDAIDAAVKRAQIIYNESPERAVSSFVEFVKLYERLDAEGRNPRVYVSY